MRDGHTYTIGGVNLIVPVVGLVGGVFVELVRHVIRGAGVHVPGWINRVGWSVSLLDARVLALALLGKTLVVTRVLRLSAARVAALLITCYN